MTINDAILDWLLQGDVSIRYQTYRDLLGETRPDLRDRIVREGWGRQFLQNRNADGSWGRGFYQPKWTSTHYTLLDLKTLQIEPNYGPVLDSIHTIVSNEKGTDGGVNPSGTIKESDVCINGMFLNYASYFGEDQEKLESIVDFILDQKMEDGGFNCRKNRSGAHHSSLHSTISVVEGIQEYLRSGYQYRANELKSTAESSQRFMLQHRLFKSDHTGELIHKDFIKLVFPYRWKYNILRVLDYFRDIDFGVCEGVTDALEVLMNKRQSDGRWAGRSAHPGQVHFEMEKAGEPSRWITLIALRVVDHFRSV